MEDVDELLTDEQVSIAREKLQARYAKQGDEWVPIEEFLTKHKLEL
jgi:hypothetical protein